MIFLQLLFPEAPGDKDAAAVCLLNADNCRSRFFPLQNHVFIVRLEITGGE